MGEAGRTRNLDFVANGKKGDLDEAGAYTLGGLFIVEHEVIRSLSQGTAVTACEFLFFSFCIRLLS